MGCEFLAAAATAEMVWSATCVARPMPLAKIGVAIRPGQMQLMRMSKGASCPRATRVMWTIEPLAIE